MIRRQRTDPLDQLDPIAAEATRWFVRLHEDSETPDHRAAFDLWRDADPRHAEAYARLQRLWGASGHLPSLARPEPVTDRRAVLRGAGGLALGGVAALGAGRWLLGSHPFADYQTGHGERRTVALGGGSFADMSAGTAMSLAFSATERRIRLLDGEAWFQVARDPAGRPFVVETADGMTTALSTAFAVAAQPQGALVTVTEHAVRINAGGRVARVEQGQSCAYAAIGPGQVVQADPTALAWRQDRLVFVSRPLGEVVRVLDRWRGGMTYIADAALAAKPVTLMIDTHSVDEALVRLGASLPMRITRITSLLTIVRPID